jgi:hypothetical protein
MTAQGPTYWSCVSNDAWATAVHVTLSLDGSASNNGDEDAYSAVQCGREPRSWEKVPEPDPFGQQAMSGVVGHQRLSALPRIRFHVGLIISRMALEMSPQTG